MYPMIHVLKVSVRRPHGLAIETAQLRRSRGGGGGGWNKRGPMPLRIQVFGNLGLPTSWAMGLCLGFPDYCRPCQIQKWSFSSSHCPFVEVSAMSLLPPSS